MSIFSKLLALFKKVLSKLFGWIKKFVKKYLVLLIILLIIIAAPYIAVGLTALGAPAFLVSAFTWVGTAVAQPLLAGFNAIWGYVSTAAAAGASAFGSAATSTKLALLTGASAMIAPEETAELLAEVATTAAGIALDVVSAVGSSFLSTPLGTIAMVGLGAYVYFKFFAGAGSAAAGGATATSSRQVTTTDEEEVSYVI